MSNKLIELEQELRRSMPDLRLQGINHGQRHTGKRPLSPYRPAYARAKDFGDGNFEGQAGNDDPHVLKFIFAGSGFEQWATHEVEQEIEVDGHLWGKKTKKVKEPVKSRTPGKEHIDKRGTPIQGIVDGQKVYERRKTSKKLVVSYAGPLNISGASDTGANSTHNNLKHAMTYLGNHCIPLIENGSITTDNPLIVPIKAHSRGAATASEFTDLMKTIYGNFVRFTIVLHDPVPGPGSYRPFEIDLTGKCDTTWILPVDAGYGQYGSGFTPQTITGATRILVSISPQKHSTGLTEFLTFEGAVYKGMGLASLPASLFYIGEDNVIRRIQGRNNWNRLWKQTLYSKSSGTVAENRVTIVPKAVDAFLNDGQQTPTWSTVRRKWSDE